jgi:hypothetical protein
VTTKAPKVYAKALKSFACGMEKFFKSHAHEFALSRHTQHQSYLDIKTLDGGHIYSRMVIETNKYIENHQDKDYAYSMVTVLINGVCKENNFRFLHFLFPNS